MTAITDAAERVAAFVKAYTAHESRDHRIYTIEDRDGSHPLTVEDLTLLAGAIGEWEPVEDEPEPHVPLCETPGPGHECVACQA